MVRGLTTAAGLWVTAAIGLACGTGMYAAACITTLLVILGLEVLVYCVPRIGTTTIDISFSTNEKDKIRDFVKVARKEGLEIYSYELKERHIDEQVSYYVNIELKMKRNKDCTQTLLEHMDDFQNVTISSIE